MDQITILPVTSLGVADLKQQGFDITQTADLALYSQVINKKQSILDIYRKNKEWQIINLCLSKLKNSLTAIVMVNYSKSFFTRTLLK